MRKKLRFLFRYITTPYHLRRWFNTQILVVLLVAAAFFTALAWTQPAAVPEARAENFQQQAEATATPAVGPTRAATLSPEYLANGEQTIGVTLVGAVLVLIVVVGVLAFMPRHEDGR